ncbi:MAG: NAD(P)-dependent oxidoreductase [Firmicutes bacterium]|nr:NAD(P)-dependent oxidoreductase [Bacillota bacterium]
MAANIPRVKMATVEPDVRNKNFDVFLKGYTKEEAMEEASRCLGCKVPKCKEGCPIHNNIPEFLAAAKEGDFAKAYELICEKSNLSEICGTVCPHEDQCEGHCVRGVKSEPLAIGSLERFVSQWAREQGLTKIKVKAPTGKKIACIGAGPATLACADVLLSEGHEVVIFEEKEYIGGVLAWGIPSYRLGRDVIEDKVKALKEAGAKFVLGKRVTDVAALAKEYDAVFLGVGATVPSKMGIPGEDLKGVYPASEFLSKINLAPVEEDGRRHFDGCGKRILVVGGGNVAMDAARDAVRLPQAEKVYIVYRRTEAEMPACTEELEHAKEEGIEFMTLRNPVEFKGENGKLTQVVCAVMELGEPDASGRRRPLETEGRITLDVDTAVLALGFNNDREISQNTEGLEADKWGCFIVDDKGRTSIPNVYAGGDAVTGAATVVKAMQAGITAAKSISEQLR